MDCIKLDIRQLVNETVDWFVTVRYGGHKSRVAEDWDITPYQLVNIFHRFKGLHCLYLQGQAVKEWLTCGSVAGSFVPGNGLLGSETWNLLISLILV